MIIRFIILILITDILLYIVLLPKIRKPIYSIIFVFQTLLFVAAIYLLKIVPNISHTILSKVTSIVILFYLPKISLIVTLLPIHILNILRRYGSIKKTVTILRYVSFLTALSVFIFTLYGITAGRYNFKHRQYTIGISNLPSAFEGVKIVHLTDLHLGSLSNNYKGIDILIDEVNALDPDIVVFSGDMVNSRAEEMTAWIDKLSQIEAKSGKFAVTGNHDHGDHEKFVSKEAKQKNLISFYDNMNKMGFTMLNNSNKAIVSGNDTIYICGVMNTGNPPFSNYGDLKKATEGCNSHVKILLSHNPSHFENEVIGTDIPLTFSGHTHAMQMGIDLGFWKWSPSKYTYKMYDGIYKIGDNTLHVSRGQGYIGLAGRIGLRPDITTVTLTADKNIRK